MGNTNTSPGVYVTETDYSQRPESTLATIGVVIGEAYRGPVGQTTLVTSESDYINNFGKPDASLSWLGYSALAFLTEGNQLYVTRVAPGSKYGGCVIGWDGKFNTSRSFIDGVEDPEEIQLRESDLFAVYAVNQGTWNSDLYIRLTPDTKIGGGYFTLQVYVSNIALPVESWRCHLTHIVDGFGVQLNVAEQINRKSKYIRIVQNEDHAELLANPSKQLVNTFDAGGSATAPGIQLVGGENGVRATTSDFINALDLYRDPEAIEVSLFINSGITDPDFQTALDSLCQDRMDCIAILDAPSGEQSLADVIAFRRNTLHLDSTYSALYSPDVLVADKHNDIRLYTPVSGYIAACYARTDRDYRQWFAPAGMIRGNLVVAGVREVYDQGMRDALYDSQVNAIRVIEGAGIKVWGADTLQVADSALSNINVRRLMILIEKTISNTLLYSVFDPNDQLLRSRIQMACRKFLKQIKDGEGLYAFDAICDETNNTNEIVAAGDMVVDLWCDPTLPAKRIFFNAIINKTGVRVTGA